MYLTVTDDFDLEKISESGQCFRWERQTDGSYRIIHGGYCLYILASGRNLFWLDCTQDEFETIWRLYFDLQMDYRKIRGKINRKNDPFLAEAAEAEQGIRILRQDPWEVIISFLISQNRNIPLIRQSIEALCDFAGEERTDRLGRTYRTFPTPAMISGLSEDVLRGPCKLGYRWRYVRDVSHFADEGNLNPDELSERPDEEVRRVLLSLPGIGEKVAGCILLFGFHRMDAFPVDVWIRRVLENEYPTGYDRSENQPYNGIYQQYMFAYYRNRKGKNQ